MFVISLGLLVIIVLAALVTVYVAFPHRGADIPHAEWLSDAMVRSERKVNDKLVELDDRVTQKLHERTRD